MKFREPKLSHRHSSPTPWTVLTILALFSLTLSAGCMDEPEQTAQVAPATDRSTEPQQIEQPVQASERSRPQQAAENAPATTDESQKTAQPAQTSEQEQATQAALAMAGSDAAKVIHSTPGLNEKAYYADVIARAKLIESDHKIEEFDTGFGDGYRFVLVFRFEVLEYLKGTGNGELVALATGPGLPVFSTREAAEQLERELKNRGLPLYDTRWDDREAIVFGYEREVAGWPWPGPLYWFGDDYAVDGYRRIWLPSAAPVAGRDSDAVSSQGMTFLLDPPDVSGVSARSGEGESVQPRTLSVAALRELVVETDKVRQVAEKDETYNECRQVRYRAEADIELKKRSDLTYISTSFQFRSGLPVETVIALLNDGDPVSAKIWFEGRDADFVAYNSGDMVSRRPLVAREYAFYFNFQPIEEERCNYYPDEYRNGHEVFVYVTAPEGTLHEAFFDPVAMGSAIGADGVVGVLEPASFESDGGASATIGGIAWEAGKVTMSFSPSPPGDHHVDFIALDGSTALRLDLDDASRASDGDSHALTWTVCDRPWSPGDQLMLRIAQSPPDLTGATNDTTCP